MPSDDYARVATGGALRIKGGTKVTKHKQKKSKTAAVAAAATIVAESKDSSLPASTDTRTDAERKFEETQRKRMEQTLQKRASKSHREAVEEYNKYLSSLSEHNDMPKIGPG
ncbi:uncharacterized protein V1518DRAFT_417420 [Limtongia smithiae]|uniref:uncharacterized protein n=1 Tax=Limtongia smithiae TaxID=1125753 RepID=UPI0034CDF52B